MAADEVATVLVDGTPVFQMNLFIWMVGMAEMVALVERCWYLVAPYGQLAMVVGQESAAAQVVVVVLVFGIKATMDPQAIRARKPR